MSIANESQPVINLSQERTRLRSVPETENDEALLPELQEPSETYEFFPEAYADALRRNDDEIEARYKSSRENVDTILGAVHSIHERDIVDITRSNETGTSDFERKKQTHLQEFEREVRIARENYNFKVQQEAFDLALLQGNNELKRSASDKLVLETEAAAYRTREAANGGLDVQRKHIERREALIGVYNDLVERINDKQQQIVSASSRITAFNEEVETAFIDKQNLQNANKALRREDAKIRSELSKEQIAQLHEENPGLNEDQEYVKEVIQTIYASHETTDLIRIMGDLKTNMDSLRDLDRDIATKHRLIQADELLIQHAENELIGMNEHIANIQSDLEQQLQVVGTQLEKQNEWVANTASIFDTLISGNTAFLRAEKLPETLVSVKQAVIEHRHALAMNNEKYQAISDRPTPHKADEKLPDVKTEAEHDMHDHTQKRIETAEVFTEQMDSIKSVFGVPLRQADIAVSGLFKNGLRMKIIKKKSVKTEQ